MSFYSSYEAPGCGCLMHYLYYYCGLNVADTCIFGDGKTITYFGKKIATYYWFGSTPEFVFYGDNAKTWEENQKKFRDLARYENLYQVAKNNKHKYEVKEAKFKTLYEEALKKTYS